MKYDTRESETVILPSEIWQNVKEATKEKNKVPRLQDFVTEEPDNKKAKKFVSANMIAASLMDYHDFCVMDGQLYIYDAKFGYWKIIPVSAENRELRALISEEDKSSVTKNLLNEIYEWICIEAENMDETRSQEKYYLNFKDCAIDWRNRHIAADRKNLYFDYYLNLNYMDLDDYNSGAMKGFLKDVFGDDKKTKKEFSKFFGLCLSNIRTLKTCGFLYGPSNTGKSVMLNLLKLLVGEQWTASVSFSQLSNEFAITRMLGKRINLTGEVSGTGNKKLDVFKSLTGNDTVEVCFKGKDYFPFRSKCILVFACNNFPQIQDIPAFQSFLSRVVIFPFSNVKPRSEWIDNMKVIFH